MLVNYICLVDKPNPKPKLIIERASALAFTLPKNTSIKSKYAVYVSMTL